MKKVVVGSLLAAVAMFVWGAAYWMNPLPYAAAQRSADDRAAGQVLLQHFPNSGTYILPGLHHEPQTLAELHQRGPIAVIHLQRRGRPMMAASVFISGFLHYWITTLLIALLLSRALPALARYWTRVGFVAVAGLAAAFFTNVGHSIWWYQPWGWSLVTGIYDVTAWVVAGLVLAAYVKPETRSEV